VSRRENHDSSEFYARFTAPELTNDEDLARTEVEEPLIPANARDMNAVKSSSVALVVTSPPYFAGKEYEEALGEGHVPKTYLEYLDMLREVFDECKRVLEPGGRIAVNVANLGRKPYRSLSADVIEILQDDLGLLMRGEVIWVKAEGNSSSCAWGSFRSAANPVLRDTTERIIIASKGRFDRALSVQQRQDEGFAFRSTLSNDEFMEATLDVWRIPSESARRVKHPAPFPVEIPQRLIDLYTYEGDLVLDPFIGSGTTAVAAIRRGRRYMGYDTDAEYLKVAARRVAQEVERQEPKDSAASVAPQPANVDVRVPTPVVPVFDDDDFQARATAEGKAAQGIAHAVLERAGFQIVERNKRLGGIGLTINLVGLDAAGVAWYFDVSGAFTTTRGGLLRTDTVWKSLGRAHVLAAHNFQPLVLLTSHLPKRRTGGDQALRSVGPRGFFDAVEMLSDEGLRRLSIYAQGGSARPLPGFWSDGELDTLG